VSDHIVRRVGREQNRPAIFLFHDRRFSQRHHVSTSSSTRPIQFFVRRQFLRFRHQSRTDSGSAASVIGSHVLFSVNAILVFPLRVTVPSEFTRYRSPPKNGSDAETAEPESVLDGGESGELPTHEKLMASRRRCSTALVALRKAPIVEEDNRGPVFVRARRGERCDRFTDWRKRPGAEAALGRPNRTTGQFSTSYKTRVLPTFLTVIDDPTMKEFNGKSLVGNYDVDDDGVKAQP